MSDYSELVKHLRASIMPSNNIKQHAADAIEALVREIGDGSTKHLWACLREWKARAEKAEAAHAGALKDIDNLIGEHMEIEHLLETNLEFSKRVIREIDRAERAEAALKEAGKALKPFEKMLRSYHAALSDSRLSDTNPRVGDLRRARAVLEKIEGDTR